MIRIRGKHKTLAITWVSVKVPEKGREKYFMKYIKTFQPKTALHLPTLLQLHSG